MDHQISVRLSFPTPTIIGIYMYDDDDSGYIDR